MRCQVCNLDPCETPGTCAWESDSWKDAARDYAEHRPLLPFKGNGSTPPGPVIKPYADFIADFEPIDYLLDGILIQSFLYAMTGHTGTGKTAVALQMAASIAQGIPFAGRETTKHRVLYLAAENPLEVKMRCIAMAQQMNFDPAEIGMFIIEGVFKISEMSDVIKAEATRVGGDFGLVVVDTGPVFFEGDDQNSRVQMLTAARILRGLIDIIPGKPTVLALMHPTKNATTELVPAGGGSFLNEIDGNLTITKSGDADVELGSGKMRGPDFNPLNFKLNSVPHETLKTTTGKQLYTVFAEYISPTAQEDREKAGLIEKKRLLRMMRDNPGASTRELATMMGWTLANGEPYQSKALRRIKKLGKLAKQGENLLWELSTEGRELANS